MQVDAEPLMADPIADQELLMYGHMEDTFCMSGRQATSLHHMDCRVLRDSRIDDLLPWKCNTTDFLFSWLIDPLLLRVDILGGDKSWSEGE